MTGCTVTISSMNVQQITNEGSGGSGGTNGGEGVIGGTGTASGTFFKEEDGAVGILANQDTVNDALVKIDRWIFNHLVDAPPRLGSGLTLEAIDPTSFMVSWVLPSSYELGVIDRTVPFVTSLNFVVRVADAGGESPWPAGTPLPATVQAGNDLVFPQGSGPDVNSVVIIEKQLQNPVSVLSDPANANRLTLVEGANLLSEIRSGDELRIGSERRKVLQIISATQLRVDFPFPTPAATGADGHWCQTRRVVDRLTDPITGEETATFEQPSIVEVVTPTQIFVQAYTESIPLYTSSLTQPEYLPLENSTQQIQRLQVFLEDYSPLDVVDPTNSLARTYFVPQPGGVTLEEAQSRRLMVLVRYTNFNSSQEDTSRFASLSQLGLPDVGLPSAPRSLSSVDGGAALSWTDPEFFDVDQQARAPQIEMYEASFQSVSVSAGLSRSSAVASSGINLTFVVDTPTVGLLASEMPALHLGHSHTVTVRARNTVNGSYGAPTAALAFDTPIPSAASSLPGSFEFVAATVQTFPNPGRRLDSANLLADVLYRVVAGGQPRVDLSGIAVNDLTASPPTSGAAGAAVHQFEAAMQDGAGNSHISFSPYFAAFDTSFAQSSPQVFGSGTSLRLTLQNQADVHASDATRAGFHAQIDAELLLEQGFTAGAALQTLSLEQRFNAGQTSTAATEHFNADDLSVVPTVSDLQFPPGQQLTELHNCRMVGGVPGFGAGFQARLWAGVEDLARFFFVHGTSLLDAGLVFELPPGTSSTFSGTVSVAAGSTTVTPTATVAAVLLPGTTEIVVDGQRRRVVAVAADGLSAEVDSAFDTTATGESMAVFVLPDGADWLPGSVACSGTSATGESGALPFAGVSAGSYIVVAGEERRVVSVGPDGASVTVARAWTTAASNAGAYVSARSIGTVSFPSSSVDANGLYAPVLSDLRENVVTGGVPASGSALVAGQEYYLQDIDFEFTDTQGLCTTATDRRISFRADALNLLGRSPNAKFSRLLEDKSGSRLLKLVSDSLSASPGALLLYSDTRSILALQSLYRSPYRGAVPCNANGDKYDQDNWLLPQRVVLNFQGIMFSYAQHHTGNKFNRQIYHIRPRVNFHFVLDHEGDWAPYSHVRRLSGDGTERDPYKAELQMVDGAIRSMNAAQAAAYRDYGSDYAPVPIPEFGNPEPSPGDSVSQPDYTSMDVTNQWRVCTFLFDVGASVAELDLPSRVEESIDIEFVGTDDTFQPVLTRPSETDGIEVFARIVTGPLEEYRAFGTLEADAANGQDLPLPAHLSSAAAGHYDGWKVTCRLSEGSSSTLFGQILTWSGTGSALLQSPGWCTDEALSNASSALPETGSVLEMHNPVYVYRGTLPTGQPGGNAITLTMPAPAVAGVDYSTGWVIRCTHDTDAYDPISLKNDMAGIYRHSIYGKVASYVGTTLTLIPSAPKGTKCWYDNTLFDTVRVISAERPSAGHTFVLYKQSQSYTFNNTVGYQPGTSGTTQWINCNSTVASSDRISNQNLFYNMRGNPLTVLETRSYGNTTTVRKRFHVPQDIRTGDMKVFVLVVLRNGYKTHFSHLRLRVN